MPKFLLSLTRDASEDGELVVDAKDQNEARRKFFDNDYIDEIKWSAGDWAGDTQLVEILPYEEPSAPQERPRQADELSLDVDAPDKVAGVLRSAANRYNRSATDLACAWQDDRTPMIWARIAGYLDAAASDIERAVITHFNPPSLAPRNRAKRSK